MTSLKKKMQKDLVKPMKVNPFPEVKEFADDIIN
jgi:hypothetical protein